MKNIRMFSLTTIVLILRSLSFSQGNNWSVILLSGDTLSQCTPSVLVDSVLELQCPPKTIPVLVDSIRILMIRKGPQYWTGAGYGALVGVLAGGAIGAGIGYSFITRNGQSEGQGTQALLTYIGAGIGLGAGFAIGGNIGASVWRVEVYDLSKRSRNYKIQLFNGLTLEERKP